MEFSTSSVKMNGIPVLPPLITNDITTEIQYYKQLSVAVEERLKALEFAKEAMTKYTQLNGNGVKLHNEEQILTENNIQSTESKDQPTVDYPTKDKEESLIDFNLSISENVKIENLVDKNANISEMPLKPSVHLQRSVMLEDKSCLGELFLGDSVDSDTITTSTDLNQYLNTSVSTKTDTTETTPENWKPQVPKSLDIVPITMDKSKPPDRSHSIDAETPKLIRQGSYVLETPSPVLIAHMQNEFGNSEYKPSSAQSAKCRESNTSQTRGNWESQNIFKEPRMNSASKLRKSSIVSQRVSKSVSNSKTGSPLDLYQPAKSVDCIQAMFAKECYSPKNVFNRLYNQNPRNSPPVSGNNSPKPVRRIEKKTEKNESNLDKSFDRDSVKSNDSNVNAVKHKSVITSEKIVTVFKEVQDTHKKQMIDLITRQQKEQLLMQENFKKQQILLLAQIRKAFPEISISTLSEAITGKNTEHITPLSSRISNGQQKACDTQKSKLQCNGINHQVDNSDHNISQSSLEFSNSPKELSSNSCHLVYQPTTPMTIHQNHCQANQHVGDTPNMIISRVQLSNIRTIDDIPVGNPMRRHSNVSRQLFPYDSKSHVPVIDTSKYTEIHNKAAYIITAYAKGFLVRRLMKTEKVIALKNTYREALHCMLKLHVDAPLNLPELNFHQRLQLQCDAASMNIVDLFSQSPTRRMEIIAHDREIKRARSDRPSSARSYSFATQRTLARKKMKEMGIYSSMQSSMMSRSCPARTRCQTWTPNLREKRVTASMISQGIKRSTSAGAVRKPWR
ncbi:uncharacterized protein LOC131669433 isoform X2 [Phymastichus coffea]|uniref:uncharacterized protein LOC131669433 isoform X2 n=1 Tax=Phymastichus coffea TaxID=108790 RepID=UPI00273C93A9|nr:uncharacterized protein LOC131669433 isoform X2 [Phymastichus coffea]